MKWSIYVSGVYSSSNPLISIFKIQAFKWLFESGFLHNSFLLSVKMLGSSSYADDMIKEWIGERIVRV